MNTPISNSDTAVVESMPKKARNPWKIFGITVIVLAVLAIVFLLLKSYFFPTQFKPVALTQKETRALNQKLNTLNLSALSTQKVSATENKNEGALTPEAYTENDAKRHVFFSEREINALIAHNTDMADKLAIDLSDNLASARLLIPLDPDMPMFGGKTLKINAGVEISFKDNKPIVKLRGVSAWGVPVPDAWLGNMKNVDLVNEFDGQQGFWQTFAEGIDYIEIREGKLQVTLKP